MGFAASFLETTGFLFFSSFFCSLFLFSSLVASSLGYFWLCWFFQIPFPSFWWRRRPLCCLGLFCVGLFSVRTFFLATWPSVKASGTAWWHSEGRVCGWGSEVAFGEAWLRVGQRGELLRVGWRSGLRRGVAAGGAGIRSRGGDRGAF